LICDNCLDWGETITYENHPMAIPCPKCKRLTWPNLGINCPAGSAVAFAVGNIPTTLRLLEMMKVNNYNET
jgi:hypothetical protein